MAGSGDGGGGSYDDEDFYGILGLDKKCTPTELRNAYKKLAMRWHPDRCSASESGNTEFVEEAKKKFQAIQQAYSVLSDADARFLYDVGVYDTDDHENNHGMGEFLNEMAAMMRQTQPCGNGGESFEELQDLFREMFQDDAVDPFAGGSRTSSTATTVVSCEGSTVSSGGRVTIKRSSSHMNFGDDDSSSSSSSPFGFEAHFQSFCPGAGHKMDAKRGKLTRGGSRGVSSSTGSSGRPRH